MISKKEYVQFGLKYGIPMTLIGATLAMKKSSGFGKLLTFSVVTPAMLAYLYSLIKTRDRTIEAP